MRRTVAVLFTLAPFVAGALPALSRRRDPRMLCMALAATLVARVVIARMPPGRVRVSVSLAFALATVAAAAVARAFGARAVAGIVAVALVLASSAAIGAVLGQRGRTGTT